ncbi:MAG: queuosine 5'-phosphate N-glycosylase/hydrolase [Candidatus Bipolaricaulaceae bacterium]
MESPVRSDCSWVMRGATWVRLDRGQLHALSRRLVEQTVPAWEGPFHFRGDQEITLRYLLVLDALNFCFWPGRDRWRVHGPDGESLTGYAALAYVLRRIAEEQPRFYDPAHLAGLDEEALRTAVGNIPCLPWRVRAAREVGTLLAGFGSALGFFQAARSSCRRLVELVTAYLPSFRDVATYRGRQVRFYKRAQILCADLFGALEGWAPGDLQDMEWLTAFPDYKLPQFLRSAGALELHPALAAAVDRKELIPAGSSQEVELRAGTVMAVEELAAELRRQGRPLRAFEVDWMLWHLAQTDLRHPHHRTLTFFY